MANGLLNTSFCGAFLRDRVQSGRDPAEKASTECLKGDSWINYGHFFHFNDSLYYLIYFYCMLHIWLVTMFVLGLINIRLTLGLEKKIRRGHFDFSIGFDGVIRKEFHTSNKRDSGMSQFHSNLSVFYSVRLWHNKTINLLSVRRPISISWSAQRGWTLIVLCKR